LLPDCDGTVRKNLSDVSGQARLLTERAAATTGIPDTTTRSSPRPRTAGQWITTSKARTRTGLWFTENPSDLGLPDGTLTSLHSFNETDAGEGTTRMTQPKIHCGWSLVPELVSAAATESRSNQTPAPQGPGRRVSSVLSRNSATRIGLISLTGFRGSGPTVGQPNTHSRQ